LHLGRRDRAVCRQGNGRDRVAASAVELFSKGRCVGS
jgi:hypothetical protein